MYTFEDPIKALDKGKNENEAANGRRKKVLTFDEKDITSKNPNKADEQADKNELEMISIIEKVN